MVGFPCTREMPGLSYRQRATTAGSFWGKLTMAPRAIRP